MKRAVTTALVLIAAAACPGADAPARILVACAPGYPGTTEDAQPLLDDFARAARGAAGWAEGSLGAVYLNRLEEGVAHLGEEDAALALVPLAFYQRYGKELALAPRLLVVEESGASEVWSLVAAKGKGVTPETLDGWEIAGLPGYAPAFVRETILAGYGELPEGARVVFTGRVLSALRRASRGEDVAVLLDSEQAASLEALPFGDALEIVHRSAPVPGSLLCSVGERMSGEEIGALTKALLGLHSTVGGAEAMREIRIVRFEPVDPARLPSPQPVEEAPAP
jgi:hypothetical protein